MLNQWELTPPLGCRFINQVGGSVHLQFGFGREKEVIEHIRAWLKAQEVQVIVQEMHAQSAAREARGEVSVSAEALARAKRPLAILEPADISLKGDGDPTEEKA